MRAEMATLREVGAALQEGGVNTEWPALDLSPKQFTQNDRRPLRVNLPPLRAEHDLMAVHNHECRTTPGIVQTTNGEAQYDRPRPSARYGDEHDRNRRQGTDDGFTLVKKKKRSATANRMASSGRDT